MTGANAGKGMRQLAVCVLAFVLVVSSAGAADKPRGKNAQKKSADVTAKNGKERKTKSRRYLCYRKTK